VGLVFELPLSGERNDAERAAAKLAVPAARARLEAAAQTSATEAEIQRATLERARRQGELAAQTAALAAQSVEAQQKRVESGAGVPLEVREAEDALRRARLAEERARVDAAVADVRLAAATGDLLLRWGAAFAE
jgi:outer membrane protein TolC